MCMSVQVPDLGRSEEGSDTPELKFQMVVNNLLGVLESKLRSSIGVAQIIHL